MMRSQTWLGLILTTCVLILPSSRAQPSGDCVILLHGLARTHTSMRPMARALEDFGYRAAPVDYPSRDHDIQTLAVAAVTKGIDHCAGATRIHFVTHSLGGILVREYLAESSIDVLGRVVMLAPPNKGSEVVDNLKDVPGFQLINGPAGLQLGTDEHSVPLALGAVDFELGIIAGSATINPFLSQYLPNPDDGKVSVARTRVEGMKDFLVLPVSHPFIMRDDEAIRQTIHFLANGSFDHPD